ncbi:hypothetical protein MtrunA17_Chr4g0044401 [Medicago truncatula]|uniref:Uncharacterized protein n=1 Tax=Medicago truncatula TaxID=3880 RepID=A0A396IH32_MEDTR|nr:uncharacterized protein LOC112421090 [Medicago truncatula]XP_024637065.1 uncharacterized protein LOC112421090 [Medicago truncatula]RHN62157.1 hypothetical protein MtrunA17_Chr4g0044401 [Medicago truncatula]
MEHVERIKGYGEAMHGSVRRERLERLRPNGRVPRCGRGKGRAHCNDGERSSQVEEPEYEPQVEMEVQVEGDSDAQEVRDDEQQRVQPEPELEELDDYPGGPHDLTMLTKYHVHVTKMAADGVWRDNLKCVNNGKKIEAIHDDSNKARMVARWFRDGLRATVFHGCRIAATTRLTASCVLHLWIDGTRRHRVSIFRVRR